MSKSIFEDSIERLQAQMQDYISKMNSIKDDDIYGSKRTYIGYKIELLKRDILIEQLMLPARQKAMLESMKPLIIDKNLLDGILISKEKAKELLETLDRIGKSLLDKREAQYRFYDYSEEHMKKDLETCKQSLGGKQ